MDGRVRLGNLGQTATPLLLRTGQASIQELSLRTWCRVGDGISILLSPGRLFRKGPIWTRADNALMKTRPA